MILIENMRREGFELAVSRPRVVLREIDGVSCGAVCFWSTSKRRTRGRSWAHAAAI